MLSCGVSPGVSVMVLAPGGTVTGFEIVHVFEGEFECGVERFRGRVVDAGRGE